MQSRALEGILKRVPNAGKMPQGKGSLELIEEATQLVRTAPAAALASYYLGSLPFVLGALYFWGDMSQSAFADQHLVEAAFGLALLFVWMKFWQARFAGQLRFLTAGVAKRAGPNSAKGNGASVSGVNPVSRVLRVFVSQLALQPIGLFLVSVAMVLTLPFGWVYAFFQNIIVLADGEITTPASLVRKAARLAKLWPAQNHVALLIFSGFGFFVFLNLATFTYLLPGLIKMLLGVESIFTRSGMSLLNSTFFAAMAGLTYLCVDPLVKAFYALRCFYGESIESGDDLKLELKQATIAKVAAAVVIVLALGHTTSGYSAVVDGSHSGNAPVQLMGDALVEAEVSAEPGEMSTPDLDQAIRHTIQHRKYTWRAPREKATDEEDASEGLLSRFFRRVQKLLSQWLKSVGDWLDKILRKLFQGRRSVSSSGPSYAWMVWLQVFLYLLIAGAVAGLGFLIYRFFRDRNDRAQVLAGEPIQSPPDLNDLNIGPEQLPEDGWTRLARELLARGEWRLALRAFYLASLAHLAGRHLISLAKFKSNREYERELRRRAHSLPELLANFGETVSVFDGVWYGRQEINGELVGQFATVVERIKGGAGAT